MGSVVNVNDDADVDRLLAVELMVMGNFFRSKPNIIILVTIILCRYDGPYNKGDRKGPQPLLLINPKFFGIFDDMFYRLPFPTALELERLLKRNEVILAGNAEFLSSMRAKLEEERALGDFERGWKNYLAERLPPSARTKIVYYSSFAERNRSPTPETDGATATGSAGGVGGWRSSRRGERGRSAASNT